MLALLTSPDLGVRLPVVRGAAPSSVFTVTLNSPVVYGMAQPGAYVTASMLDACVGGRQIAWDGTTSDASGRFTLTLRGGSVPVNAVQGRRVLYSAATEPVSQLCIPRMVALADVDLDLVTGMAPPSVPVTVTAFIDGVDRAAVEGRSDISATFGADFSSVADLGPGTSGLVSARLLDHGHVSLPWAVPRAALQIGNAIALGSGAAGGSVHLTLERDGLTAAVAEGSVGGDGLGITEPVDWSWNVAFRDDSGRPVDVRTGDVMGGTIGDQPVSVGVEALSADVDLIADTVAGVSPPSSPVSATVRRGAASATRGDVARPDGTYSISFAGEWDIEAGDSCLVEADIPGGHSVRVQARGPSLVLRLNTGEVSGSADRGAVVSGTLEDSDGRARGRGMAQAGDDGAFVVAIIDERGSPAIPIQGDLLHVVRSGITTTMLVPELTVEAMLQANLVRGNASPGGRVVVRAVNSTVHGWYEAMVVAVRVPSGAYAASFGSALRLAGGSWLEVDRTSNHGHIARLEHRVPMLYVQRGGSRVSGYAGPGAWVTATHAQNATVVDEQHVSAGPDGAFEALLSSLAGGMAAGDLVTVSWSGAQLPAPGDRGVVTTTVLALRAEVDVDLALLTGRAPPASEVSAVIHDARSLGSFDLPMVVGDPSGAFTATLPSLPSSGGVRAGAWADVSVAAPNGPRTYVLAVAPYLDVLLGSPRILARAVPLGVHTITLTERSETLGLATASANTEGEIEARLDATSPGSAEPAAGQVVVLREPDGRLTSVLLPRLSVELAHEDDVLRGEAPAGMTVTLSLFVPGHTVPDLNVLAGADGKWLAMSSDLPDGIDMGDISAVDASVRVGNGHRIVARTGEAPTPTSVPSVTPGTPTGTVSPTAEPSPDTTPTATLGVGTPWPVASSLFLPSAHRFAEANASPSVPPAP